MTLGNFKSIRGPLIKDPRFIGVKYFALSPSPPPALKPIKIYLRNDAIVIHGVGAICTFILPLLFTLHLCNFSGHSSEK